MKDSISELIEARSQNPQKPEPDAIMSMRWVNLTKRWNDALEDYRSTSGRHWHGTLRGSRGSEFRKGHDCKRCRVLIVVDNWQGEPINLSGWHGYPDYWDFRKVIAQPFDDIFYKRKSVIVVDHVEDVADHIVEAHNASLANSVINEDP